jgi:tetratricopeptide (TPR) repeat protein
LGKPVLETHRCHLRAGSADYEVQQIKGIGLSALKQLGLNGLKVGCLVALAAGIVWNVRLAVADLLAQSHQPANLRSAMRLMPANGVYAAQLADELYATDSRSAASLLRMAVRRNPYDASSWIQLGLLAEVENNMGHAKAALLQAAQVDATFLPAWSLANFYFRQQNAPQFWHWAQRAAQMDPGDATSLLRLAWYVTPSAPAVVTYLQLHRPAIEAQFVDFLIAQHDPVAVSQAAVHLLQGGDLASAAKVLEACDWLLSIKHPSLALPLWNALATRRQVPWHSLNPAQEPDTVTNGQFAQSPTSLGFDWHMPDVAGVSSFLNANPNSLGFELSGQEPDGFVLLSQVAPIEPEKTYILMVDYATSGIPPGSGLAWKVTDDRTGTLLAQTPSLHAQQGGQALACFATAKDSSFIDLSLAYQRQPGSVHPEGKLALKRVRLLTATANQCPSKISNSAAASPAF